MLERKNFLQKYHIFLFFILVSGFISIFNLYNSAVIKHTYYYSEVKEAFLINKFRPNTIFVKPSSINTIDQCNLLTNNTELCNISITVKTTKSNHQKRLKPIIQTWFSHLSQKVYFITDEEDREFNKLTRNHLIDSKCGSNHFRESLSCKLREELRHFLRHPSNWYCHFDDDNYLNIRRLFDVLKNYDFRTDWYIGKKSISHKLSAIYKNRVHYFSFATGGAGFCLSNSLFKKIVPYIDEFVNISNSIGLPDDCSIGFIIECLIGVNLTENFGFHSHLEYLGYLNEKNIKNQISFSYNFETYNFVNISSPKSASEDLTKFIAIHCNLYTGESICSK